MGRVHRGKQVFQRDYLRLRIAERQKMVVETVNEYCPSDCVYRMSFDFETDYCAYCLVEHEVRGCPVSKCSRYRVGNKKVVIDGATLNYRWIIRDDEDI